MPKSRLRVPFGDWSGGLNQDDAPGGVARTELRTARNVYWKGRALSSRQGSSRLQSSAVNSGAAGGGVFELVRSQGTARDVLAVFGTKLYKAATAATPTDITGAVTITAGADNLVTFTHVNDLAVMCNGVDSPWKWSGSGTAAALGGTPPVFSTMVAKWNRTFGAGHAAAPRTIRFSALGDPETWASANTVAAILGDSSSQAEGRDYIRQLGHLGDSIFVGLANSLGRVLYTGDSTTPFRYNQLSEFGMVGRSYVAVGNGGYFLSDRGVHFIRPSDILITYETSMISGRRLRQTWNDLNRARLATTTGVLYRTMHGNLLVLWPLALGSATTHDTTLVMDVTDGPGTERFALWTGWAPNAFGVAHHSSTLAEQLLWVTTDGFVWQGDTGTSDHGTAYVAEAATRWEDFDTPATRKRLRDLYVEVRQSGSFALSLDCLFDYASTAAVTLTQSVAGATQAAWGSAVWGTDVWPTLGFVQAYLLGLGSGRVLSFRVYTNGADEPWTVYTLVPAVEAAGETKESTA